MLHHQQGRSYPDTRHDYEGRDQAPRFGQDSERGRDRQRGHHGYQDDRNDDRYYSPVDRDDDYRTGRNAYASGGRSDDYNRYSDDRHSSRAYSADSDRFQRERLQGQRPTGSHYEESRGYLQPQPPISRGNFNAGMGESWSHDVRGGWQAGGMNHGTYGPGRQESGGYASPGYESDHAPGRHGSRASSGGDSWSYGRSATEDPRFRSGPKGYKRSDERLKEDVCERLMRDPRVDASDVSVEVHEGKVSLTGNVPERSMKHTVEDIVDSCMGVSDIDNRVRVDNGAGRQDKDRDNKSTSSGASSTTSAQRKS